MATRKPSVWRDVSTTPHQVLLQARRKGWTLTVYDVRARRDDAFGQLVYVVDDAGAERGYRYIATKRFPSGVIRITSGDNPGLALAFRQVEGAQKWAEVHADTYEPRPHQLVPASADAPAGRRV